ncbi:alpha/beta fold hydrolase [Streptomyces sp. 8L]|uniref:alpha/beta fold hydrolase n=1 Tax=Streptomyces sp. 8L TaxID=2877242 RepID=UPI001CD6EFF6|nr:alpha/beta hydrolase [Streptomyces sp. 8L]MCA1222784.1 alpha/beta hydrolase [Streptomyces sp. 8L]
MTAKSPTSAPSRRTWMAVSAAAALTAVLAGCGRSGASAASHPATGERVAATAHPASRTDPGAHRPTGTGARTGASASAGTHMITNEGHRLAFHVIPGRLPAIVLDAGGGEDSSYWKTMAPALSKKTGHEIITYDRAGMGASDEVPGPWNAENAVSDLKAGLTALGADHVILVPHSEAGEIATCFARAYPGQVDGAVLVDATLPQFSTDTEIARVAAANQAQVDALKGRPTTKAERQLLAVAAGFVADQKAYHKVAWPSRVPATAIVSGQTPFPTSPPDAQAWRGAQAEFVKEAPNRHLVTATRSSHDIPLDHPGLVESRVEAMLKAVG